MKKNKKKTPLISIIMNCHNGAKYLNESINSILNQNYNNWELIFWDNKSDDLSKKILFSFKDKRIKYYKSIFFLPLYAARNQALKKAKGDYITFLDADDIWKKNKLNKQTQVMIKKNLKFTFSNYYIVKNKKKKIFTNRKLLDGHITQELLNSYYIAILTVMFNKNLLNKFNLKFDEKLNIIGDFDLFIKLSQNISFGYIHEPLAFYRLHENNYSKKNSLLYANEMQYWYKKNLKILKNYSLNKFILQKEYIKIKSYIYEKKYKNASQLFLKYPISLKKIKLFILFFIPKKYFFF